MLRRTSSEVDLERCSSKWQEIEEKVDHILHDIEVGILEISKS